MATPFAARFQRKKNVPPTAEAQVEQLSPRVGEILSDNSDVSSIEEDEPEAPTKQKRQDDKRDMGKKKDTEMTLNKTSSSSGAKIRQLPAPGSRGKRTLKKTNSRKWYSDSENEEDDDDDGKAAPSRLETMNEHVDPLPASARDTDDRDGPLRDNSNDEQDENDGSDLDKFIAESMTQKPKEKPEKLKRLSDRISGQGTDAASSMGQSRAGASAATILSPQSETESTGRIPQLGKRTTSFQKLVARTKMLSPFALKRKELWDTSPGNSPGSAARHEKTAVLAPPLVDTTPSTSTTTAGPREEDQEAREALKAAAKSTTLNNSPSSIGNTGAFSATQGTGHDDSTASETGIPIVNRRTSRLKHSPSSSDNGSVGSTPRQSDPPPSTGSIPRGIDVTGGTGEAMSPNQRKMPGAFAGKPGSGVLLEGWLRQKQRRGMKGMKKWNSRYFVLYAKTNEVRYYADVVQSAWGPLPLGEIGSISLRLIQRIGKPGHPKYKGCRFDITCRNTWGTHYADDYVSSDEENNANNEEQKQEKSSTPRSSRVYSLMADSPQVTVAWVNMLDSLLTRSANSPRPDVAGSHSSGGVSSKLKKMSLAKNITRRRSSTLEAETMVLIGAGDNVPKAVLYAIKYIFDSTPGIETEHFYELEPDTTKLRVGLKFLNQCSTDPTRKPTKAEMDTILDPITAGAIVKVWLKQLEQPIIPFEMFDDFYAVATEAKTAPFELRRNLKALIEALPRKSFAMLACLLFHLNEVNVYSSKNCMDASLLANIFAEYILRPRQASPTPHGSKSQRSAVSSLVEEMITHVDAMIDEKEAEAMNEI